MNIPIIVLVTAFCGYVSCANTPPKSASRKSSISDKSSLRRSSSFKITFDGFDFVDDKSFEELGLATAPYAPIINNVEPNTPQHESSGKLALLIKHNHSIFRKLSFRLSSLDLDKIWMIRADSVLNGKANPQLMQLLWFHQSIESIINEMDSQMKFVNRLVPCFAIVAIESDQSNLIRRILYKGYKDAVANGEIIYGLIALLKAHAKELNEETEHGNKLLDMIIASKSDSKTLERAVQALENKAGELLRLVTDKQFNTHLDQLHQELEQLSWSQRKLRRRLIHVALNEGNNAPEAKKPETATKQQPKPAKETQPASKSQPKTSAAPSTSTSSKTTAAATSSKTQKEKSPAMDQSQILTPESVAPSKKKKSTSSMAQAQILPMENKAAAEEASKDYMAESQFLVPRKYDHDDDRDSEDDDDDWDLMLEDSIDMNDWANNDDLEKIMEDSTSSEPEGLFKSLFSAFHK